MNKKVEIILDVTLAVVVIGGAIYLSSKYISKTGQKFDKIRAKHELEAKQLKENIARFNKEKNDFMVQYSDSKIAKATLQNPNIETMEEKAYMYQKLKDARDELYSFDYYDNDKYAYAAGEFLDLLESTKMDKDSLNAKLYSLHENDKTIQAIKKANDAKKEAELKHQRELEKIEREKNKELAVYEAKLKAEQAKFKTVCETMKDAEKKVQANVNLKTDLEA